MPVQAKFNSKDFHLNSLVQSSLQTVFFQSNNKKIFLVYKFYACKRSSRGVLLYIIIQHFIGISFEIMPMQYGESITTVKISSLLILKRDLDQPKIIFVFPKPEQFPHLVLQVSILFNQSFYRKLLTHVLTPNLLGILKR